MNTQNETVAESGVVKYRKLESLPEEMRARILELATQTRQIDLVEILREQGMEVSPATLNRFLMKHRQREVLEDGKELREGAEALTQQGDGEALRKGTIAALRQKMYQRAMVSEETEESREMLRDVLKEEAKLKELELEARKTAALEEGMKLQRLRIEIQAEESRKRTHRPQRAEVIETGTVIAGELPAPAEGGATSDENSNAKGVQKIQIVEGLNAQDSAAALARLTAIWERMGEVLNRGGRPEEKVIEARGIWEEGRATLAK